MEPGTQQPLSLPATVFAGVVPRARVPQMVTSPSESTDRAVVDSRRQKLEQRLQAVLQGCVQGFACEAGDFYVLNASSSELQLRSSVRPSEGEPAPERRPLGAARADVAAMAGSVIVLEDDLDVASWSVPAWCGAAVCLPVASDETIHGTLWLYSSEPRMFADAELQLAEVVAGRLAVELELDAWRSAGTGGDDPVPRPAIEKAHAENHSTDARAEGSRRAEPRLVRPNLPPQLDDWELAGWTPPAEREGAFYDWQTLADGRTLVASGAVGTCDHDSWLEAARIALRAHAGQCVDAGELLTHANHTLWLASPGGEGLAVAVALLDGDGAHVSIAAAGEAGIARWRAATCDWTPASSPPLGWSERTVYAPESTELIVRERLVLATATDRAPTACTLKRLAAKLRQTAPNEMRSLPGKRALKLFGEAANDLGMPAASLALVRRR